MLQMTTQVRKQAIRQRIIIDRERLGADERAIKSHQISKRIASLEAYRKAGTVLAYMSFGAEYSTRELVRQALREDKRVLLPRVNVATKELDLYQVSNLQHDLAPGQWNIPEPLVERCPRIDLLRDLDFILLPGVAFGRDGVRLGYGGGFYDKLLARIAVTWQDHFPALVAGAFSMQLIEGIPQEQTDYKVEWIVTENEVIPCAAH
ncbi:5-formyltetrahydrofolate cyclo-ligase [Candidatus Nitrotoga fabula]|uniref:5-formyltetrahydrofolate cyclo-ligase n=2 Tax=Candidatus Nitrotoga fabula TaxID=2182327 RepID=A0A916BFC9_9PROT|nr:5-formyltetrahydrofolate cyclo-ligase [Candidatus Nitrotoga fabula]